MDQNSKQNLPSHSSNTQQKHLLDTTTLGLERGSGVTCFHHNGMHGTHTTTKPAQTQMHSLTSFLAPSALLALLLSFYSSRAFSGHQMNMRPVAATSLLLQMLQTYILIATVCMYAHILPLTRETQTPSTSLLCCLKKSFSHLLHLAQLLHWN